MNAKFDQQQIARADDGPELAALAREDPDRQRQRQRHLEDRDPQVRQAGRVADEVHGHHGAEPDRRIRAEVQRGARIGQPALLAAEVHRDAQPDNERRAAEDQERHPPRVVGGEDAGPQVDHVRREHRGDRDADRQAGDDHAHPEAALLDRRLLGDQAAVVGVEGPLAEPVNTGSR
jgi:hypothetical protein